MSKRVAILFSSGLDSTYLVWKNLKDGNTVIPIYIEIQNNYNKVMMEKNRVGLLMKEFQDEFNSNDDTYKCDEKLLHDVEYAASVNVNICEDSLYFKQIPIWMFGVVFLQSLKVDEIQIGYVSNDDAIPYLNDIKKIYKSYQSICDKMIPLVFPLSKMKKWQMAKDLPKKYMDLIYTCENPRIIESTKDNEFIEYKPCCCCIPCKTIISTNYYESNNYPENYKEQMLHDKVNEIHRHGYRVVDENGEDYMKKREQIMAEEEMLNKESSKYNSDPMPSNDGDASVEIKSDKISISLSNSECLIGSENYI